MSSTTTQTWPAAKQAPPPAPGVHLPFTAPLLGGARGRLRDRTVDYILPNLSGGRGAYVALWSMVSDFASPTLHDTLLSQRLAGLPLLTPSSVRAAARAVACEGYAGRAAAAAGATSRAAIDAEALRLWASFLMAMVRRGEVSALDHPIVLNEATGVVPSQVADGFAALAHSLGWEPALLSSALEQLSTAFVPIAPGTAGKTGPGRVHKLLALLRRLHDALLEEQSHLTMQPLAGVARILGRLEQCLAQGDLLLAAATAACSDPAALVDRWRKNPAAALAPMSALEAALDGWDRICLLWLDAPTLSARVGMIGELSRLASIAGLPACAKPAAPGAPQPPGPPGSARPAGPAASPDQASATTALADPPSVLVERNERVRADELALDDVDA
ncbi:hypothetical protein [Lichenicola sp.]|uniref:hypothetical protein n=1 Tax=Lichenicola sp. TaxID=2804529 RepID=UPI003B00A5B5